MAIGIEVELLESFSVVAETLSRLGVANKTEKKLYPTAYILHRQNRYYICHFKEMMILDRCTTNVSNDDIIRRNSIVKLLMKWNLVKPIISGIVDNSETKFIHCVKFSDKNNWTIEHKYRFDKRKKKEEQISE